MNYAGVTGSSLDEHRLCLGYRQCGGPLLASRGYAGVTGSTLKVKAVTYTGVTGS